MNWLLRCQCHIRDFYSIQITLILWIIKRLREKERERVIDVLFCATNPSSNWKCLLKKWKGRLIIIPTGCWVTKLIDLQLKLVAQRPINNLHFVLFQHEVIYWHPIIFEWISFHQLRMLTYFLVGKKTRVMKFVPEMEPTWLALYFFRFYFLAETQQRDAECVSLSLLGWRKPEVIIIKRRSEFSWLLHAEINELHVDESDIETCPKLSRRNCSFTDSLFLSSC